MKNTNNQLEFSNVGYGQWTVSTTHYGKIISMHFTVAPTYDLIHSKEIGYKGAIIALRSRIIQSNK